MDKEDKIECPACSKLVSAQMPNCPFCTQPLGEAPAKASESKPMSWDDTREVAGALAELEAAKEDLRKSQPTFTTQRRVTGPITGLISLVQPAYGSGVVQIVEIILAVVALPTILVGLISTMMGGKKWGRIPFFFVVLPAALVTLISYQMQSPIWFPVFLTSLVAYRGKPLELRPTVDRRARFRGYGEESCDIGVTEWTERYFGEITHPDAARRPCHDGVHGVA